MKAVSVLALAAMGVAGVVEAQISGQYRGGQMQNPPSQTQTQTAASSDESRSRLVSRLPSTAPVWVRTRHRG